MTETPESARGNSPCPICGEAAAPFREVGGYTYLRCAGCRFVFLDPMPERDDLDRIYKQDAHISADNYPKARSRRRRAFAVALRFIPFLWRRDVVDVGCGGGFTVEAFRRLGGRAVGLDISGQSIDFARKRFPSNEYYCETFGEFRGRGLDFDFVYSSEVIEHVTELSDYMAFLADATRDGGHLYITTPDIESPQVPAEITEWDVFEPPRHVQFFGEDNLCRLFDAHGFEFKRRYRDRKAGLKVLFRKR